MSLTKWHQPAQYQPALHHGEKMKLNTMYTAHLENSYDLLDVMDPSSIVCVNPYDVNPIADGLSVLRADVSSQINATNQLDKYLSKLKSATTAASYQRLPPSNNKIKVEMEEFGDISTFVPTSIQNTMDELNTPVFSKSAFIKQENKEPFDFSLYDNGKNQNQQLLKRGDACVNNNHSSNLSKGISFCKDNTTSENAKTTHHPTNEFSRINTLKELGKNTNYTEIENTPSPEEVLYYQDLSLECEAFTQNSFSNINSNSTSPMSDYLEDSIVLNTNHNSGKYMLQSPPGCDVGSVTPEDSNTSIGSENTRPKLKPKMHLNVNLIPTGQSMFNLSTPDVIDEVVDLENADFNILDLVNNEDIRILNADEELLITQQHSNIDRPAPPSFYPAIKNEKSFFSDCAQYSQQPEKIPEQSSPPLVKTEKPADVFEIHKPLRKPRKRKASTDDDEEYLPPTARKALPGKLRKTVVETDYDSDSEYETKHKPKPRGRPPKRTESISSDCSKDSDVSKYRELRDKNNEASRRSRLKRKTRELEYEKEADEMELKNVKLKAQVAELEKMVNNFRTNLFKIMINK